MLFYRVILSHLNLWRNACTTALLSTCWRNSEPRSSRKGQKNGITKNNGSIVSDVSDRIRTEVRPDIESQTRIQIPLRAEVHGSNTPLSWKYMGGSSPMKYHCMGIVSLQNQRTYGQQSRTRIQVKCSFNKMVPSSLFTIISNDNVNCLSSMYSRQVFYSYILQDGSSIKFIT